MGIGTPSSHSKIPRPMVTSFCRGDQTDPSSVGSATVGAAELGRVVRDMQGMDTDAASGVASRTVGGLRAELERSAGLQRKAGGSRIS